MDATNVAIAIASFVLSLVGVKRLATAREIARVVKLASLLLPEATAELFRGAIRDAVARAARATGITVDGKAFARAVGEIEMRRELARLAAAGERIPASVRRWRKQLDDADRKLRDASDATAARQRKVYSLDDPEVRRTMGNPDDTDGGAP